MAFKHDGVTRLEDIELGLFSSIEHKHIAYPRILRRSIHSALRSTKLSKDFSETELLEFIESEYSRRVSIDKNPYYFVSGVLLEGEVPFPQISYRGSTIQFVGKDGGAKFSHFIQSHIATVDEVAASSPMRPAPLGANFCVIEVSADSDYTAESIGTHNVDVIRGLMNLVFNETKIGSWMMFGNIEPHPLNDIPRLPFRTIHEATGEVVSKRAWFDRNWAIPKKLVSFEGDNSVRLANFHTYLEALQDDNGLVDDIEIALEIYCRALDKEDWRLSFLELWAVLEILLLSSSSESHVNIPKRLANIYKESELVLQSAHQLREFRNLFTHRIYELDEADSKSILDRLNRFVCAILRFAILNQLDFKNAQEMRDFLDIRGDAQSIERRISLYRKAQNFRKS